MKIAIHDGKRFNIEWIEYCDMHSIAYKVVNCYSSSIIKDLYDCNALMWHFEQENPKDVLFAKQLLYAVQASGKKVFPDFNSVWHFDDKIGQKYLFKSINAPLVPSYVFYTKDEALKWFKDAKIPIVNKLRSGSASNHVKLISSRRKGVRIISKSFKQGFKEFDRLNYFKDKVRRFREGIDGFSDVLKGFVQIFIAPDTLKQLPTQKGYVYFQDFIPGNTYDIRLIVIGSKAYGMKRMVRENDFRASGSSIFIYDKIDSRIVKKAFEISEKLKLLSVAYDFILSLEQEPLIVELSCFFGTKGSSKCNGYWDRDLNWHEEEFNPFGWMVDTVLNSK